MKTLYSEIVQNLLENKVVVETTIVEQNGSAPRTAGTKMLVFEDSSISGTIGGGLYEAKAIEYAKQLHMDYKNNKISTSAILSFDLKTKSTPTDMDMICGGDLRVLVECIPPTTQLIEFYNRIVECEKAYEACTVLTKIKHSDKNDSSTVTIERAFISENEKFESINKNIVPNEIYDKFLQTKSVNYNKFDGVEYFFDSICKPYKIYIFGAGHVSCDLAKITNFLDFKTIVLDDRSEFCNRDRFPDAEIKVLPSLDKITIESYLSEQNINNYDGIIIVTRGHARDKDVLECSVSTKAGYIGMIGSKSKRQSTYNHLISKGYAKEDFDKIYSPIGLSIGAQSPQEIAISISAQLIQWRSNMLNTKVNYE